MLESARFDFRSRHPQVLVVKLVRDSGLPKGTLGRIAFDMCIDIYRTWAPLKQTAQTMAIACVELTARLLNLTSEFDLTPIVGPQGFDLEKWNSCLMKAECKSSDAVALRDDICRSNAPPH